MLILRHLCLSIRIGDLKMRNINRYGLVSNETVTAYPGTNIRSLLTTLEETRANLLLTKELGTYSAEIQQAIINIEQSILYLEHYIGRREKAGIFTVDIPENLSETHSLINKTQMTDVVINILEDSAEGHEIIRYYKFEKTYPAQEFNLAQQYFNLIYGNNLPYRAYEEEGKVIIDIVVKGEPKYTSLSDLPFLRQDMMDKSKRNTDRNYYFYDCITNKSFDVKIDKKAFDITQGIGRTRYTLCNEEIVNKLNELGVAYAWRYDCPNIYLVLGSFTDDNFEEVKTTITNIIKDNEKKTNIAPM